MKFLLALLTAFALAAPADAHDYRRREWRQPRYYGEYGYSPYYPRYRRYFGYVGPRYYVVVPRGESELEIILPDGRTIRQRRRW